MSDLIIGAWIDANQRMPQVGAKVLCRLQHWHTKGIQEHQLVAVDESDCTWRTADDNSEVSHDWTVIEWFDPNAEDDRLIKLKEVFQVMRNAGFEFRDDGTVSHEEIGMSFEDWAEALKSCIEVAAGV